MASLLSNLIHNLAKGIHPIKCRNGHCKKICKKCGIKYKGCECCLEYKNVKDNLAEHKCLYCNKIDQTGMMKTFYNHLNMEDITDADYMHLKRLCKNFEIKRLGEYHDLYVQRDTLLLAPVFENFQDMCLEIYEHDPAQILLHQNEGGNQS